MPYTTLIIVCLIVFFVCLVLLNYSKIKLFFQNLKLKNNYKQKSNKSKKNRIKPTENQIRPILKPPEEHKLLEEPKTEKPVDNTYERKEDVKTNNSIANENFLTGYTSSLMPSKNRKFKTREELDKEFNDIKNFLNSSNSFVKNESGSKPIYSNRINLDDGVRYNKNVLNLNASKGILENKNPYKLNYKDEPNIIKIDGDEIDLNKLPLNMRKLLISNVLAKKNFD